MASNEYFPPWAMFAAKRQWNSKGFYFLVRWGGKKGVRSGQPPQLGPNITPFKTKQRVDNEKSKGRPKSDGIPKRHHPTWTAANPGLPRLQGKDPTNKLPDVCTSIQCNYTIVHFKVALRRDASASAERRRYS